MVGGEEGIARGDGAFRIEGFALSPCGPRFLENSELFLLTACSTSSLNSSFFPSFKKNIIQSQPAATTIYKNSNCLENLFPSQNSNVLLWRIKIKVFLRTADVKHAVNKNSSVLQKTMPSGGQCEAFDPESSISPGNDFLSADHPDTNSQ
ncbi:hypothetical protein CEXT_32091 [Caerostris extrusa]|uniref:Uncharacterized protein n=1 Tax=Caerostris extrusa TaxID=172846 RepID=A0AAV4VGR5_CAEEX|nr:hypothetical protein CEXT_32091 [Caerostris extrusa]